MFAAVNICMPGCASCIGAGQGPRSRFRWWKTTGVGTGCDAPSDVAADNDLHTARLMITTVSEPPGHTHVHIFAYDCSDLTSRARQEALSRRVNRCCEGPRPKPRIPAHSGRSAGCPARMPGFRTAFQGYGVRFSPFEEGKLAVATSQNFGIIGNGKQCVLQVGLGSLAWRACTWAWPGHARRRSPGLCVACVVGARAGPACDMPAPPGRPAPGRLRAPPPDDAARHPGS